MCLKHFIDRYNIYYVYGPSKISRNIHATAINFVIIAIILMQMCVFFFLYLRNGKSSYLGIYFLNTNACKLTLIFFIIRFLGWMQMSLVSLAICLITVMIFFGQVSFQWFLFLSPISYKVN